MKVKELIKLLEKENPEMEVVVNGYEDGFDNIKPLYMKTVRENPNPEWFYGRYEETDKDGRIVLVLPR